jgi:uncharacterized protein (TIGR02265 family)
MDDGFAIPSFDSAPDLDAYLRHAPEASTCLGSFFQSVLAIASRRGAKDVERALDGVGSRRWIAFKQYPIRDFMRLAHNVSRIAFPKSSEGEGLRRLGHAAYPTFAATMAGRVAIFAFGEMLEDVLRASPRAYRLAAPQATVTTELVGPRHFRMDLRNVPSFVDTYQCGVIEGCVTEFGFRPDVRIRMGPGPMDAMYDVKWR